MEEILGIRDLAIEAIIGVYPDERLKPQTLLLDIWMEGFFGEELEESIDYAKVAKLCEEEVVSKKFLLIESLGRHLQRLLREHYSLTGLRIRVKKPGALSQASHSFFDCRWGSQSRGGNA